MWSIALRNCGAPLCGHRAERCAIALIRSRFYHRGQGVQKFTANYRVHKKIQKPHPENEIDPSLLIYGHYSQLFRETVTLKVTIKHIYKITITLLLFSGSNLSCFLFLGNKLPLFVTFTSEFTFKHCFIQFEALVTFIALKGHWHEIFELDFFRSLFYFWDPD